ncbi:hypothetical protein Bbelb_043760 [Branchiostoma belcheri]|nr:hypothetical protein Bbelb_043760 [Branchiostoma belcheri]
MNLSFCADDARVCVDDAGVYTDDAPEKNLKLNKRKMRLRLKQVPYMGQLPTAAGLRPDPEKVRAITEMKTPDDSLQRFLGMVNYLNVGRLAKFLPHLSDMCEPLRRL